VQYADAGNFSARQSIYRYQQPRIGLYDWALDLAGLDGDERILDVGCGNGGYLKALHQRGHRGLVVGVDFSAGMLRSARSAQGAGASQPVVQGDAAALPFAAGSVDVGLAMHMLYHVPDRGRAVAELRRVVAPGGVALVVLNGRGHTAEVRSLIREWFAATGGGRRGERGEGLDLDAGEELVSPHFDWERHEVRSQLVVPEAQPVVDYVRSLSVLATGTAEEASLLKFVRETVMASIARHGAFRIATASGCLVCR
jgi:SAM-dependent methyltransferase